MSNSTFKFTSHRFNGNAEGDAIEIDGKKFVDDGTGKAKVGDDGKPVPFVEAAPTIEDVSKADIETLAKTNPAVAAMLAEKQKAEAELATLQQNEEKARQEAAEKGGEFEKLYNEEKQKREKAEALIAQKDEMLGKYVGSVESILAEVIKTIPKEKLGLIPSKFSPREKLEYITANAALLGADTKKAGGGIPKSDITPTATEEDKLQEQMDELMKKGSARTALENQQLAQIGTKLTKLRREKEEAK